MLRFIRKIEDYSRKKNANNFGLKSRIFQRTFKRYFSNNFFLKKEKAFLFMFAEILLGEGGAIRFSRRKNEGIWQRFAKQPNQLFWREERRKHCTTPGVGGGARALAHHGRDPLSRSAQHGSCPRVHLSWSWDQHQGTESLFHLQMLDLRSVKTPCQQEHNATSPRQKKANIHRALQVKRNVGFAEWGWHLSEISHRIPPKSQERKGRHKLIPASQVLVPWSQAMTTSAFRSTQICYLPSCWMPVLPFQGPRHDI